ncbi:hypothetical protein C8J57DRAFT_1483137 [Mycena rebaudengoi]|nr:hypothetical protein C8J57DRAFT_1483137 [Mycena rebaudengoi]
MPLLGVHPLGYWVCAIHLGTRAHALGYWGCVGIANRAVPAVKPCSGLLGAPYAPGLCRHTCCAIVLWVTPYAPGGRAWAHGGGAGGGGADGGGAVLGHQLNHAQHLKPFATALAIGSNYSHYGASHRKQLLNHMQHLQPFATVLAITSNTHAMVLAIAVFY